jgi:flagellar protein FliO/FliZ
MKNLAIQILILFSSLIAFANEAEQAAAVQSVPAVTEENQIPVVLEKQAKADSASNPVARMLLGLGVLAVLGFGAFYYSKKNLKPGSKKDENLAIKIVTQHYLGPKKSLAIVRVAGESILVGITDNNISMIKSLSLLDEDVPEEVPKTFTKALNQAEENQEDFSISGIKDIVSNRLRNMRNLE